jgi:hypothetical protein
MTGLIEHDPLTPNPSPARGEGLSAAFWTSNPLPSWEREGPAKREGEGVIIVAPFRPSSDGKDA